MDFLFAVIMLLSTLRFALTQDTRADPTGISATVHQSTFIVNAVEPQNLTDLLSTDSITADLVVLHQIKNNTLAFVNAARQFFIKHYSVENFRTQDLAVGDGVSNMYCLYRSHRAP
jgi:hypothetical protein